jgi:outer membrane lipoprotein carrier protein
MRVSLFFLFYLLHAVVYAASGMDQLQRFHNDVNSIEADFYQVLKDTSDNKVQESKGKVWIKRPGLFRWEYNDPYPQVIVADGQRILIYDPELDQVTIKQEASAIGNAPALVLSGKYPLARDFKLTEVDRGDQYQWVSLVPKQEDSDFAEISVAFLNDVLIMLELKDNLGQRTQIHFKSQKTNSVIDASKFHFNIPPGTDVIGGDQL